MSKPLKKYENIIWDWNGTLLNDADICIASMNTLLEKRSLDLLNKTRYLEIFGFPVKDYYKKAGFDFEKEAFEIPAMEYIDEYKKRIYTSSLHNKSKEMLNLFQQNNISQYILSAMEEKALLDSLGHFDIKNYFKAIYGLNDNYAVSKTEMGIKLLEEHSIDPEKTLLIGDTIHDLETAAKMNVDIVLIANGHQNKNRLLAVHNHVIDTLEDLPDYLS